MKYSQWFPAGQQLSGLVQCGADDELLEGVETVFEGRAAASAGRRREQHHLEGVGGEELQMDIMKIHLCFVIQNYQFIKRYRGVHEKKARSYRSAQVAIMRGGERVEVRAVAVEDRHRAVPEPFQFIQTSPIRLITNER